MDGVYLTFSFLWTDDRCVQFILPHDRGGWRMLSALRTAPTSRKVTALERTVGHNPQLTKDRRRVTFATIATVKQAAIARIRFIL